MDVPSTENHDTPRPEFLRRGIVSYFFVLGRVLRQRKYKSKHCRNVLGRVLGQKRNKIQIRSFKLEYLSIIRGHWDEFDLNYLLKYIYTRNRNNKIDYEIDCLSIWTSFSKAIKKTWVGKPMNHKMYLYLLDNFVKRRCQHSIAYFSFFVYINCNICALGSRLLSNLVVIWLRFLIDC